MEVTGLGSEDPARASMQPNATQRGALSLFFVAHVSHSLRFARVSFSFFEILFVYFEKSFFLKKEDF